MRWDSGQKWFCTMGIQQGIHSNVKGLGRRISRPLRENVLSVENVGDGGGIGDEALADAPGTSVATRLFLVREPVEGACWERTGVLK